MAKYDIELIAALGCDYNLIFGERGNGKTTAGLLRIVEKYAKGLGRGAYLRQMDMDLKGHRGASVMASLRYGGDNKDENLIHLASDGKYDQVKYLSRAWYLGTTLEDETIRWEKEPFCYAFAITNAQHDKGATPSQVRTIVFDEFIPLNSSYVVDELHLFRNLLSTIIRSSDDVEVFLFANSITWNSPYFEMFGATKKVRDMEQGETVVLTMPAVDGTRAMKVALEYCAPTGGKKSDVYFAFADETSAMITNGKFVVPQYPQCPHHFSTQNTKATYWMHLHNGDIVRSRLMKVGRELFVFNESVTREKYEFLKDDRRDLFYSMEFSGHRNHFMSPLQRYADRRTHYLVDAFASNRLFFESNEVGEDLMYFVRQADAKSILNL